VAEALRLPAVRHLDVDADFSDSQIAETFLRRRALVVPVTDGGKVTGVITRSDFFRSVAERFLGAE
jgi:CBS domain-containing protein